MKPKKPRLTLQKPRRLWDWVPNPAFEIASMDGLGNRSQILQPPTSGWQPTRALDFIGGWVRPLAGPFVRDAVQPRRSTKRAPALYLDSPKCTISVDSQTRYCALSASQRCRISRHGTTTSSHLHLFLDSLGRSLLSPHFFRDSPRFFPHFFLIFSVFF